MARRSQLAVRLRRRVARALRASRYGPIELVYSPEYRLSLGAVPVDPQRGERIVSALVSGSLTSERLVRRPPSASLESIRRAHTDEWLGSLRTPQTLIQVVGYEPNEEQLELALRAHRSAVGGTLLATRRALALRRTVVNLGGGFHHARPERGMGFCVFNDLAIAVADVRARGFTGRILIVDLDLHDGNGTRAAFADDPSVHTYSLHNQHWDDEKAVESTSIELGSDIGDELYLRTLEDTLPALIDRFAPELLLYVAGTDPADDDRLGDWKISAAGLARRDRRVVELARGRHRRMPLAVVLGGGYGNHTWRHTARSLAWLITGSIVEPPSTEAITLVRYRNQSAVLSDRDLVETSSGEHSDVFILSDEDVHGGRGIVDAPTRVLGHFSPHGVELLFEGAGLFDQIRRRGFRHPTVHFELGADAGDTIRVYGDDERRELLIELRIRRDRRTLSGFELLSIEWLLLQNPRRTFNGRTAMPGQTHPGLGMLGDVISVLVILSERRGLDGILFVPSHYHLATKGKRYLRFVEPSDEAFFRAIRTAVGGVPMAEATRAVDAGRVLDRRTGESIAWRPMPMVLPLSVRLRAQVHGSEYEARVRDALEPLDFELG